MIEYILAYIHNDIQEQPTHLNSFPTTLECQLEIVLHRLAHGCSFSTVRYLFGISESLRGKTFNNTVRLLVAKLYGKYVKIQSTGVEWETGLRGFIENYKSFPVSVFRRGFTCKFHSN